MASFKLKSLFTSGSHSSRAVQTLCEALGGRVCIVDAFDRPVLGTPADLHPTHHRLPVSFNDENVGFVMAEPNAARPIAELLTHLAAREAESRTLASEVLHLYRELNLFEQLSEDLSALLDINAVSERALQEAQRLISSSCGAIFVYDKAVDSISQVASFGDSSSDPAAGQGSLSVHSRFLQSAIDRGAAEIINDCASDPRVLEEERPFHALVCAPLRAGELTSGAIVVASSDPNSEYSSADLKLLNTIALLTSTALENALLCAEMVTAARDRAAYTAELQAASTVQQLLLHRASRTTPGFDVQSVYLPASEVGGDLFFLQPAPDSSLIALIGDVSGKGLTAAMRVAMILGALNRETSCEPDEILSALNNALIAQGELGFTTACCIRIYPSGEFVLANGGHISPFISGVEFETEPSLPLGMVPDQTYAAKRGTLRQGERIVFVSDGVPEARAANGQLFGLDRLPQLSLLNAHEIAEAAENFGQEDDITVLTIALA
ncbi:MAG: PP2C family protein-serine/threonine phosphatase [Acidobacteriaceae bacterium]